MAAPRYAPEFTAGQTPAYESPQYVPGSWQPGRKGHAVLGTYTRGGTVFTCGSTDWSHGLRGRDPIVERITRNVLDRLGK